MDSEKARRKKRETKKKATKEEKEIHKFIFVFTNVFKYKPRITEILINFANSSVDFCLCRILLHL